MLRCCMVFGYARLPQPARQGVLKIMLPTRTICNKSSSSYGADAQMYLKRVLKYDDQVSMPGKRVFASPSLPDRL
jgi:hypothetical protein